MFINNTYDITCQRKECREFTGKFETGIGALLPLDLLLDLWLDDKEGSFSFTFSLSFTRADDEDSVQPKIPKRKLILR